MVARASILLLLLLLAASCSDPEGTARISCSALVSRAECDSGMLTGDLCFECVDRESVVLCEID